MSPFPTSRSAITRFTTRWNNFKLPIHDYFFAAASGEGPVRVVSFMFITSRGTMDKLNSTLRELLFTRTELLGAIRLPTTRSNATPGH